ncbi:MAG: MFS transporter [Pseudomonadota bacterium]
MGPDSAGLTDCRLPARLPSVFPRFEKCAVALRELGPGMRRDITTLVNGPRSLWIVFSIKLLESFAYFSFLSTLSIYLSDELGYSDQQAGTRMSIWLAFSSALMLGSGFVADRLGIRNALFLSVGSCLAGRLLVGFADSRVLAFVGLGTMAWGTAAVVPTLAAAVRRYSSDSGVSFGFGLFYAIMNLGAFIGQNMVSLVRWRVPRPVVVLLGSHELRLSANHLICLCGALATLAGLVLVFFVPRSRHEEEGQLVEPEVNTRAAAEKSGESSSPGNRQPPAQKKSLFATFIEVVRESSFWRFMLLISLLVLVRVIFQHGHQTFPKYAIRELGDRFPFATYWSINPLLIIFLTPIATVLLRDRSTLKVITVGAFVSALSVLFLTASTSIAASIMFIVMLSIGEAMWSPRLYEYTVQVAPRGRESAYMGFSHAPQFLAKLLVGLMSGVLLATFCPADGARNSRLMWLIIAGTALVGPLGILLLRNVIRPRRHDDEATKEGQVACA